MHFWEKEPLVLWGLLWLNCFWVIVCRCSMFLTWSLPTYLLFPHGEAPVQREWNCHCCTHHRSSFRQVFSYSVSCLHNEIIFIYITEQPSRTQDNTALNIVWISSKRPWHQRTHNPGRERMKKGTESWYWHTLAMHLLRVLRNERPCTTLLRYTHGYGSSQLPSTPHPLGKESFQHLHWGIPQARTWTQAWEKLG